MTRMVSDAGIRLIASFEGFGAQLYNDPAGNCTIGYGHLVHMGRCDGRADEAPFRKGVTQQQALDLLAIEVVRYADAVERATRPDITQHQFDALTSLAYNIGAGGYINSSVRTAVNAHGDVCAALRQYVHGSDGVVYAGLQRRREAECQLYNLPDDPEISSEESDEMWTRLNGTANWWANRKLDKGPDGTMQLAVDLPAVPADAKAVDLEVFIDPGSQGVLVFKDGDGSYAGQFSQRRLQGVVRIVPKDRTCRFAANGPVTVLVLGVVGFVR